MEKDLALAIQGARKKSNIISGISFLFWILFFIAAFLEINNETYWSNYIAWFTLFPVAVFLSFLAFRIWRCPKCNKSLGGIKKPVFCPQCGVRYSPDKKRIPPPDKRIVGTANPPRDLEIKE